MNVRTESIEKWQTTCCAMGILSAKDFSTEEELDFHLNKTKKEALEDWHPADRRSGETMLLCVTVADKEPRLEALLKKKGFKVITTFKRRTGYPAIGNLKLWSINLI